MKKTLTIMLAAAMAITMTAAFAGCNNDKTGSSDATSASAATKATQKATAKATQKPTAKSTQKPTEAPTEAPTEEETEAPTEAPTEESTFNVSEVIKEDEFTADDARDALLQFLGGDERLNATYLDSVTVEEYGQSVEYFRFDVRLLNEITNSHVDYYYVINSRHGGGIYDSEAFAERFNINEGDEEPDTSDDAVKTEDFTVADAKAALLEYLGGGDERLNAHYLGSVTVEDYGKDVEYYCFDVRISNELVNSHVDNYYIIKSRFGGGIYDSESFRELFPSVDAQ